MYFIIVNIVLIFVLAALLFIRSKFDLEQQKFFKIGMMVWAVIFILVLVMNSVIVVKEGTMKVASLFGTVQERVYEQGGPYMVNPLYNFTEHSARREILEFQSTPGDNVKDDDIMAVSSDNLPLTIDVTYAYQLLPHNAWWLYKNMGVDYREALLKQSARSATRSATASFSSTEATTTKRDELSKKMEEHFRARLVAEMVRMGLDLTKAENMFVVLAVQLRRALPPAKVLNAIAEKSAAQQDLERQTTLTQIAKQEAERRGEEGAGVQKLFMNLPSDFTPEQIGVVLNALADKTKADAMLKAVETGKVSVIVMDGGSHPSVTLPHAPMAGSQ